MEIDVAHGKGGDILRGEWLLKLSPCEVHTEVYGEPSICSARDLLSLGLGRCEHFDICQIVKSESRVSRRIDDQLQDFRKKRQNNRLSEDDINTARKNFAAELQQMKRLKLRCVRRVAQQMAYDMAIIRMNDLKISFEQAFIDNVIELTRAYKKSEFLVYDSDYNRLIEVKGIRQVWSEIIDLCMMIIGLNGNGSKP